MITLKCDGCSREVKVEEDYDEYATCSQCGDYFTEVGAEEENESEEIYSCEECESDTDLNKKEGVLFPESELVFCNKCIRKVCNLTPQVITKEVEKVIEKPIYIYKYREDHTSNPNKPIIENIF